jgi:hypothetical protein
VLAIRIDGSIEKRFRTTIGRLQGTQRGNLKNALEEAIFVWTQLYRNIYDISYTQRATQKGLTRILMKDTSREKQLRSNIERLMERGSIVQHGDEYSLNESES